MKGYSIVELMVTMLIFSLFLLALTQIFSLGLKSWNIIESKTAIEQEASLSLSLLKKDLFFSDNMTVQIGDEDREYAVMESAADETGKFHYNEKTGVIEWQSYILYYTFPRGSDKEYCINIDLNSASPEKTQKKKLIRKVIKHTPSEVAKKLANYKDYFTDSISAPISGEIIIGKPHILSKHIYDMDIKPNIVDMDNGLDIELTMVKSILEDRLAYVKDFAYNVGYEKMTIKGSVLLKNTKKQ
jgi:prepilin-type N-terminal cleavage/methylation domain-containing protein